MPLQVDTVTGDIVAERTDAIVNAWNRNVIPWWFLIPQGVSRAIRRTAGTEPFKALARTGPLPLGSARATGPGQLPIKAIIHVAGINMFWTASERSVRDSARNACELAIAMGFESLAMPVIGGGTGGLGEERALALILDELSRVAGDLRVRVVRFGPGTESI